MTQAQPKPAPMFANPATAPYQVTEAEKDALAAAIDSDELVTLALELGNIPSRSREEAAAAQYVYEWMDREGFQPRRAGATPERPNIIGEYGGLGTGANLLFTAHLDTESPSGDLSQDKFRYRETTMRDPEWTQCWLDEDGRLRGFPISNDRGPMACFLMAAKALKKAGIGLAGKAWLTACPGEIGPEPIEEFSGIDYLGKDIGAHYLFHHGGVAPDYAIAAEGTDFGLTWQGCGYALFRVRIFGTGMFTPILETPETVAQHLNPIYKLGPVIDALHQWGRQWEAQGVFETAGGLSLPKTQIASVRAGAPTDYGAGTEVCAIYVEVCLAPGQKSAQAYHQIVAAMRTLDLDSFDVEPMVVRHGFVADADEVAPLAGAVDAATRLARQAPVERAHPVYSSMWRDHNVFNMQGIPAITTGMPRWRPTPEDLHSSALIYALTMLAVCGRSEHAPNSAAISSVYGGRDDPF
ncbi:acetylornithine deacetylase/succinyl-diaminopimelate desuccinylase-like protein [Sphingobium sp. B2D3A]|uniref:peptidase M20 n=1 Tax=unclassified Sphingobium TaxID=2611147 RepID=UPI002224DA7B|nr:MULTISPECIES: peptidase M20 [unclassified Sphingobium]MCW2337407.1 acetylornithine deacetylase/succinyl-diaminopimelate desuccinylase-like protein [Sphingobium sp. B2D3A]MCW2383865.1 acetylornithine deacetylase/succinyl-diaminopimelate desuccinylase-like protein [Sphingobium sp. B2D3D]